MPHMAGMDQVHGMTGKRWKGRGMQQKGRKVQLKETQSIEKETHPGHAVYSRKTDAGGAA